MKKSSFFSLLIPVLLSSSLAFARDLKSGDSGEDVKQWQLFLIKKGFMKPPALGNFSARTTQATKSFQKSQGLQGLGMVGPRTMEKARALGYGGAASSGSIQGQPSGLTNAKASEKIAEYFVKNLYYPRSLQVLLSTKLIGPFANDNGRSFFVKRVKYKAKNQRGIYSLYNKIFCLNEDGSVAEVGDYPFNR